MYAVIIGVSTLGFLRLQQVDQRNHKQFCAVSLSRWKVQHDVIVGVTSPIALPQNDAAALQRIKARNAQLADERSSLLDELGPKPAAENC